MVDYHTREQIAHSGKRILPETIEEEQTTQWPKEKAKRTNNDPQNIHKLKIV
jgi:hypothetical protein